MKKEELKKALQLHAKVASDKAVIPVLQNVAFVGVAIISTDLENTIVTNGFDVNESFCVNATILTKLICNTKAEFITIEKVKDNVIVKLGVDEFAFPYIPIDDFPMKPEFVFNDKIEITSELFHTIKKAVKFISYDTLRTSLNNVFLHQNKVFASDGKALYIKAVENLNVKKGNIPLDYNFIKKFGSHIEGMELYAENAKSQYGVFKKENIEIYYRKPDVTMPNYETAIPSEWGEKFFVDKQKLMEKLECAMLAANETTSAVKLSFSKDSVLEIRAEDIELGIEYKSKQVYRILFGTGEVITGINGCLLLASLKELENRFVSIYFVANGANTRGIYLDSTIAIMPIMITS